MRLQHVTTGSSLLQCVLHVAFWGPRGADPLCFSVVPSVLQHVTTWQANRLDQAKADVLEMRQGIKRQREECK